MRNRDLTGASLLDLIALIVIMIVFLPWINFWVAYFSGWLAKITIGGKLCAALNLLFKTDYFTPNMLPMCAGALGWIGGFFKGIAKVNKENK